MFLKYLEPIFKPWRAMRNAVMKVRTTKGNFMSEVGRVQRFGSMAKDKMGLGQAPQLQGQVQQAHGQAQQFQGQMGQMHGQMYGQMPGQRGHMQGQMPPGQMPPGYPPNMPRPGAAPGAPGAPMPGAPMPGMGMQGPPMPGMPPGPPGMPGMPGMPPGPGMPGMMGPPGPPGMINPNPPIKKVGFFRRRKVCTQCNQTLDKTWDACPYCAQAAAAQQQKPASNKTQAFRMDAGGVGSAQLLGWIVPIEGPQRGELFTLAPSSIIGTDPTCQVVLMDQFMSSKHAEIKAERGTWIVRDLGSTNGTFVNDRKIDQQELVDNDFVRFGQCIVRFKSL